MTADKSGNQTQSQVFEPDPMLKRLAVLAGEWTMTGRTLGSQKDDMTGELAGEWILGGLFLQLTGWIRFNDFEVQSIEIIGYDAASEKFPSTVFSNPGGTPLPYKWDVEGKTVMHSGGGATYRGTVSDDGNKITGGWRPDENEKVTEGNAYDMTMYRVDSDH